ncbi:hypothetical protein BJX61DRAFT_495481 [Aspergillus egyptiacus]|nr:hypothetical protein BJX61DRAFT_495481 [Aspergillus egyptiacus]
MHPSHGNRQPTNDLAGGVPLFSGMLYARYVRILSLGWAEAAGMTVLASVGFNTGLTTSIILHRAFFHYLHRFPGPWMARVTRLSTVMQSWERTQYHRELEKMHRQYGDFVCTGPREISINRPSAVAVMQGPQLPCTKSTWYSHVSDGKTQISLNSTRDPELHRRRHASRNRACCSRV